MMFGARVVVAALCRLRITGDVPDELRRGPLILAPNHIGAFDPIVLTAACARRHIAPRIMATGDLFEAPVAGAAMRAAGHLRVDRRDANVADALDEAKVALAGPSVLLAYPEGRMTLDPGLWPERGKTGLARLAIASDVLVVPVAQWGAQLVIPWGAPWGMLGRMAWAVVHRPVVRVHFGDPIALAGVGQGAKAVRDATDRIMDGITASLATMRPDEPRLPAWIDSVRPVSTARTHKRRP
jgi:1-acyl-sn-glycerol-3-phosphate acyltransferase